MSDDHINKSRKSSRYKKDIDTFKHRIGQFNPAYGINFPPNMSRKNRREIERIFAKQQRRNNNK